TGVPVLRKGKRDSLSWYAGFLYLRRRLQRPTNAIEHHLLERGVGPVTPVIPGMAQRSGETAAPILTFISPGHDVVAVGNVDLNQRNRFRQNCSSAVNFVGHGEGCKAFKDRVIRGQELPGYRTIRQGIVLNRPPAAKDPAIAVTDFFARGSCEVQ